MWLPLTINSPQTEPQPWWSCTFASRAGARACATFRTAEEAQQFAERHALASGVGGRREWRQVDTAWVLTTPAGEYRVSLA